MWGLLNNFFQPCTESQETLSFEGLPKLGMELCSSGEENKEGGSQKEGGHEASEDSEPRCEKIRKEHGEEGGRKEYSENEASNALKPRCPAYLWTVLTDL